MKNAAQREEHMVNADDFARAIIEEAHIRDISAESVAVVMAQALAAKNTEIAGKVLLAVMNAICLQPITKIAEPTAAETARLVN